MNADGTGQIRVTNNVSMDFRPSWGPLLAITAPNGGEKWYQGSTHTIKWKYYGSSSGSTVRIELLKGTAVKKVINVNTSIGSGGAGSYSWKVPYNQTMGPDYKIRIKSTSNTAYTDMSNTAFTICAGAPITVTVPNGGQTWKKGTAHTLKWSYTGNPGSTVKIELLKAGMFNRLIASGIPIGPGGSGSKVWMIPSTQIPGSNYRIKITTNTGKTDTSDGCFIIST